MSSAGDIETSKESAVICGDCFNLQRELQTIQEENEKLKDQLALNLYMTEVFKPVAIAKAMREFLKKNVPDYRERHQGLMEKRKKLPPLRDWQKKKREKEGK